MAEDVSPAVARRRLRLALRGARERAERTQQEVAEQMEWSLSKVIRIENGDNTIAPNDLRPLLLYLGVKDREIVTELTAIAKIARQRQPASWYRKAEFRETLTDPLRRLFEYESEATTARYFYMNFVAGPLQIPDYAAALIARFEEEIDPAVARARLRARQLRRATLLERAAAGEIEVRALFDESVFRRTHGDSEVLAAQLRELLRVSLQGDIKLRMVPFDATSAVTNNAGFDLLTLSDAGEVLYRETGLNDETVENNAATSRHRKRFDLVWLETADEDDTIEFIRDRIKELEAAAISKSPRGIR
jgi:transcriptional regulator with XRE-family HTH domain